MGVARAMLLSSTDLLFVSPPEVRLSVAILIDCCHCYGSQLSTCGYLLFQQVVEMNQDQVSRLLEQVNSLNLEEELRELTGYDLSEINKRAQKLTSLFFARQSDDIASRISFNQAFKVYQILSFPDDLLPRQSRIGREQSGSIYRKLALEIHPDKNGHPMASQAFQKFNEAWSN